MNQCFDWLLRLLLINNQRKLLRMGICELNSRPN
ncbi:hypothetical protein Y034_962 [Burkholderia pseudomallei MSHR449]|nr:hypothetical protein Y034_962 [Burkholderia pseudomallei MSHR449]